MKESYGEVKVLQEVSTLRMYLTSLTSCSAFGNPRLMSDPKTHYEF